MEFRRFALVSGQSAHHGGKGLRRIIQDLSIEMHKGFRIGAGAHAAHHFAGAGIGHFVRGKKRGAGLSGEIIRAAIAVQAAGGRIFLVKKEARVE
mgnify:CR=1 FL=1